MISKELIDQDFSVMEQVSTMVNDYILKGVINPTTIAKEMGLKRAEVLVLLDHWHSVARNTEGIKDRAQELLTELDLTYSDVVKELYSTLDECESPRDRNTTLKNIADVTAKRQDVYLRAGIYGDDTLQEELAMMQQKLDAVQKVLVDVAEKYPIAKTFIIEGLGRATQKTVAMPTVIVPKETTAPAFTPPPPVVIESSPIKEPPPLMPSKRPRGRPRKNPNV